MLALRIQPGIIKRHTITINDELSYRVTLAAHRGRRYFTLQVTALTLLGATAITCTHFDDLTTARQHFTRTVVQLKKS